MEAPPGAALLPLWGGGSAIVDADFFPYIARTRWRRYRDGEGNLVGFGRVFARGRTLTQFPGRPDPWDDHGFNLDRGIPLAHWIARAPRGKHVAVLNGDVLDLRRANLKVCEGIGEATQYAKAARRAEEDAKRMAAVALRPLTCLFPRHT